MPDSADLSDLGIRVLTYNLWHGRAQRELSALIETYDPDVLCVQEALSSSLPAQIGGLTLAITSLRNRLGLALYVRTARFEIESALPYALRISRHDRYVGGAEHRLVAARVTDRLAGRAIVLGSFHATPFTDSNAARRRQVDDAQDALLELGPTLPSVLAGDFNHPILLSMLRNHLKRRGLGLARTASGTYFKEGSIMRGKFDLATLSQFTVVSAVTLPQGASDHMPVLFAFDYAN